MERIVFMGTPAFSAKILEDLINAKYNIVGVVTQPDRVVGRKQQIEFSEVKKVALKYQIPVLQPNRIKKEYQPILDLKPDVIITAAFGQIVGVELLEAPKFKAINIHASLLPKYRGGAPIQRSIENGDRETGITIMYMEKGMDTGDILYQEKLAISNDDTSTTLFEKLSVLGSQMILAFLPKLFKGDVKPIKQNEDEVTYAYNLTKEEEHITFNDNAYHIYNKVRSLNDTPGAYFYFKGFEQEQFRIKIIECEPVDIIHNLNVGEILQINKKDFLMACMDNTALKITKVKPNGKAEMTSLAFINGGMKKYLGGN